MATDDRPEKSLFARIKDCVLAELNRKRNEVEKAPCPSRRSWGWPIDRESIGGDSRRSEKSEEEDKSAAGRAGGEGPRNGHEKSKEQGSTGIEENCQKFESTESENHPDAAGQEAGGAGKDNLGADRNLAKPDKPLRRYYIKMQNPEAPPCCESLSARRTSPSKSAESRTPDEDYEKYRSQPPICRCGGGASADNNQREM